MTAPELVKQWKKLVNDHVNMGRDSHMIKEKLEFITPVQMLLGFYFYKANKTVTIPQFLKNYETWLYMDESWAEIELACHITDTYPPAYYICLDLVDEETSEAYLAYTEARLLLKEWAERILA